MGAGLRADAGLGVIGSAAVLAGLAATVGLGATGWAVGLACALTTVALLVNARSRPGASGFAPADWVTLARAALAGGLAALVADSLAGPAAAPVRVLVGLAVVALSLDAFDGLVARRTGTTSAVGARFDMEVDAFLVLVLCVPVARELGAWVLLIGVARYAYLVAGWVWPWLAAPMQARRWRKAVAAVQGIALTVALADVVAPPVAAVTVGGALAMLTVSFASQGWWLWRGRDRDPAPRPRAVAATTTVLAGALMWAALVTPPDPAALSPAGFLRIPIEGLAVVALVLLLPGRVGRFLALVLGVVLGVLMVLRLLDLGFLVALDRRFDAISDWSYLSPAVSLLRESVGGTGAVASVVVAVVLAVVLVVGTPLAVRRLTRATVQHRRGATVVVAMLAAAWLAAATLGVQAAPGAPLASASTALLAYGQVEVIRTGIADERAFTTAMSDDPAAVPGNAELGGLQGKDVVVAFVESYGRVALEDPAIAPRVDAVLAEASDELAAAGFDARSGFLTSPTLGGISWLAHATLQSGLWVSNQRRYDEVLASDRATLSGAFARAGWRTVAGAPANKEDWPEGRAFYGFDQVYDRRTLGYRGPMFGFATPPDQYVLSVLQREELARPDRLPVMAEVDLVSSHSPWARLPRLVDWAAVGDGTVFQGMPQQGPSPDEVLADTGRTREAYARAIEYSLRTLVSFVTTYGGPDLVLVLVGDHQPATVVTGRGASRDVPVTVIAADPGVLERIDPWEWDRGLNPGPSAPVWPMDAFRDEFLAAYRN